MKVLQLGTIPKEEGGIGETGGVATHVWELVQQLREKSSIDVVLFAENNIIFSYSNSKDGIYGISPLALVFSVISLEFRINDLREIVQIYRPFGSVRVMKMLIYYLSLYRIIKREEPDAIHAHHLEFRFCVADIVSNGEIPIVTTTHSMHSITHNEPSEASKYHELLRYTYSKCQNIIFVSDQLRNSFIQEFDDFDGEERVIYNPVEQNEATFSNTRTETDTLLFVGNFSKRKGIYTVIDSFKSVTDSLDDIELILVGSDDTKDIEEYTEKNGGHPEIRIAGRVSEIESYYKKADLFVLPSENESFGLVYVEAMSYGTPVVGTTGVPIEVIPTDDVGYRIEPNDVSQLSATIQQALQKEWNSDLIRKHAKSFDWDSTIYDYIEFYTESIQSETGQ